MSAYKGVYYAGATVSFLGWLLAFSPHIVHESLGVAPEGHAASIFGGIAIGVLGLSVMVLVAKKA